MSHHKCLYIFDQSRDFQKILQEWFLANTLAREELNDEQAEKNRGLGGRKNGCDFFLGDFQSFTLVFVSLKATLRMFNWKKIWLCTMCAIDVLDVIILLFLTHMIPLTCCLTCMEAVFMWYVYVYKTLLLGVPYTQLHLKCTILSGTMIESSNVNLYNLSSPTGLFQRHLFQHSGGDWTSDQPPVVKGSAMRVMEVQSV